VLPQLLNILLDTQYNTPSRLLPCGLLSVTLSRWHYAFDSCDGTLPFHANG
jgi:hypothetical protein